MACVGVDSLIDGDFVDCIRKETTQMTYGEWHKQMMDQIQMDKLLELLERQNQLLNDIKHGNQEQEE